MMCMDVALFLLLFLFAEIFRSFLEVFLSLVLIFFLFEIFSEAIDLLRQWREGNERKSEEIVELWLNVVVSDVDKIGNESKYLQ